MAQLIGGVAGAILGSFVGMPQLGFMVGSMIGGAIDRATNPVINEGPRIDDLAVSSSAYGNPKPILYGTARLPAQIIWTSGIKETKIVKKSKGKGGQAVKTITYQYSTNIACGLCEGPVTGTIRIWMDGKLAYDREGTGVLSNNRFVLREYLGDESQLPDGLISSFVSPSPAYRGLCYIILEDFQLEPFGNRIPSITVEVTNSITKIDYRVPINWASAPPSGASRNGIKFDRIRKTVYVLSQPFNTPTFTNRTSQYISIYDLDGVLLKRKSIAEIFANSDDFIPAYYSDTGIEVIPGSDVYVLTRSLSTSVINMYALDGDTLEIRSSFSSRSDTGIASDVSIHGGGFYAPWFNGFQLTFDTAGEMTPILAIGGYPQNGNHLLVRGGKFIMPIYGHPRYFNGSSEVNIPGFDSAPWGGLQGSSAFSPGKIEVGYSEGYYFSFNSSFGVGTGGSMYVKKINMNKVMVYNATNNTFGANVPGWKELNQQFFLDAFQAEYGFVTWNAWFLSACYDPSDDTIIMLFSANTSPTYMIKYHFDSDTVVWAKRYSYSTPFSRDINGWSQSDVSMGTIGIPGPTGFAANTSDGNLIYQANASGAGSPLNIIWDSKMFGGYGFPNSSTGKIDAYYFNRATSGTTTLKNIVDDLCFRGGLDPITKVDSSSLSTISIKGYVVARPTTAKATLEQLSSAFFIKAVESDYKIKFYLKSSATNVETIPQKWLAGGSDSESYWKETRKQELELPKKITVTHINNEDDYQQGAQFQQRITNPFPSSWGRSEITLEFPMVLNPTEAKALATQMLYSTWAERTTYETVLPWRYALLDPTDTITVTMDNGDSYSTRITGTVIGANFHMETGLISQDATTYVKPTGLVGSSSLGFVPQEIIDLSISRITFLDIPMLKDGDAAPSGMTRVYYSSEPYNPGWPGGSLDYSIDNGNNFNNLDEIIDPIVSGVVSGIIPAPFSADIIDTTTQIVVFLREDNDELDSITEEEFLAGRNACLINKEIIYFRDAVLQLDGSYILSYLLRGRRGTEWTCGLHDLGEKFYLLEDNQGKIVPKLLEWSTVGNAYQYRLTTYGMYATQSPVVSYAFGGNAERPYSPVNITRTFSSPNIIITWARRNRYNGAIRNGVDIPLIEGTNDFDVYILSSPYDPAVSLGNPPSTYVRLYTVAAETATYTAANMTTDGFNPATSTLYVAIFQNNTSIGGFPGYATLEA